ncbi:MAG: hypothetical protein Q8Q35_02270 [Nanoarchaeota archaeon]|nr:hypothetical protein [Nanoarchaeota archaeon]
MVDLKKLAMATGLVGLLSGEVMADDDTPFEILKEKVVHLDDSNFDRNVKDYDGAALVLFYSSCSTKDVKTLNENQSIVYSQLSENFSGESVNRLPLKFFAVDACKYDNIETGKTLYEQDIKDVTTIMYLDGKEIDALVGGPESIKWIPEWVGFLSKEWVPSNLTSPNGEYAWRFERSFNEHKVPYKP